MLTAEAELLADFSDLAEGCAGCYAAARATGVDRRAITPPARAALVLGAPLAALAAGTVPHPSDADYLDDTEALKAELRQRNQQLHAFARVAEDTAAAARRAMAAAAKDNDDAAYMWALRLYNDAMCALDICAGASEQLYRAHQHLAVARTVLSQVLEQPEAFVAGGGVLPHEGRWITGESPRLSPPISVSLETASIGGL